MHEIKVTVIDYGRKNWYMRYTDPHDGTQHARSTGTSDPKEAEKAAGKWEAELQEGRYKPRGKITWQEFRERYENEVLNSLADKTDSKAGTVFNALEELAPVDLLRKLDAAQISKFQQKLRDDRQLAESSIKSYLAHLEAALNWAVAMEMLAVAPAITMPKRAKGSKVMKGRGISTEEFERMLSKVAEEVGDPRKPERDDLTAAHRYRWFLRGLWFSGLRISEAVNLSWDEPGHISVDLSGKYAMFVIPGDRQKSGEDQILPIAPEFAEMLLSVPQSERTGRVFKLGQRNIRNTPSAEAITRVVMRIGKAAGVVVNRSPIKYASAHDLRRAFGERWSLRVMPATLQQMMRHKDISTTMKYYVGQNGQKAAADIYAAFAAKIQSNTTSNTCEIQENSEVAQSSQADTI